MAEWKTAQLTGGGLDRLLSLLASVQDSHPNNAWISLASQDQIHRQWICAEELRAAGRPVPLFGVPFAAKDNIDAEGFVSTAGCPSFSSAPAPIDSTVVARLRGAGAIVLGKTNLDQFATGLVGTRSPYGAVGNAFDARRVSGGSSSGSAVVVSKGIVPFSLGTDTAGSGRVPAGLNNIVGLKPTRGAISTAGVLPACRTLDCVSIFALSVEDAEQVLAVAEGSDDHDAYSRMRPASRVQTTPSRPRCAVCRDPDWFKDQHQPQAYDEALKMLAGRGWTLEPVSFSDLFELAALLYQGPWVAERYAAIRDFITTSSPDQMDPTVRGIIETAKKFDAADVFTSEYRRQELTRRIEKAFSDFDLIVVPTTPTFPTIDDVAKQPVLENSILGTYTNFVNFLDWSALAVPAGFRDDGLPFGLTLISTAWQEPKLLALGRQLFVAVDRSLGATGVLHSKTETSEVLKGPVAYDVSIELAVVGAHLSGFPLNKDLTSRGATLVRADRTAPWYQLFALGSSDDSVRKPGLKRLEHPGVDAAGLPSSSSASIELEIWRLPASELGSFFHTIPSPLGLGSIELVSGNWVSGFICEPIGLEHAQDITKYGGWRAYIEAMKQQSHTFELAPQASQASVIPSTPVTKRQIKTVLIANRGEIAVRICKSLRLMGIMSVAIYTASDAGSEHVKAADVAVCLTGNTLAETYLCRSKIITIAVENKADALIPGYGFLAENAVFAQEVEDAGLIWVGPTPKQMRDLGLKHQAREIARAAGVPIVPGTPLLTTVDSAVDAARRIGFPVMVKSTAGGGGIGLRMCTDEASLRADFESVQRLGRSNFGDEGVFLERFVARSRHIEVQVLGDGRGNVVAVGERDCSLQRRNQKVIEECPASFVPKHVRANMRKAAVDLVSSVQYRNVGTVEFIYDVDDEAFYFLEVNTRLQVEHPVTEEVFGLDLVRSMVEVAGGTYEVGSVQKMESESKFAIEARIYAESPLQNFAPSHGKLLEVRFPVDVRVDTWVKTGTEISSSYDPLLAKIIATAATREEATTVLIKALEATVVHGVETNIEYLAQVLGSEAFRSSAFTSRTLDTFQLRSLAFEVLDPGPMTTVQDFPGRTGYWGIGIPPSGPLDDYSFRLANRILGNLEGVPGLECTMQGPVLLFHADCEVAVVGASAILVDDEPIPNNRPYLIRKGSKLSIGKLTHGCRCYVAFQGGGISVPTVLGSRSTFCLGKLGGHCGRSLRRGDILRLQGNAGVASVALSSTPVPASAVTLDQTQSLWKVAVLLGPHGCPDYFTPDGYQDLMESQWTVHYNSNRMGIRLSGPRPAWARKDGGAAGLHPSNIHDSPYAIGSVSFTGDEAVVLTGDGPSLGGFVVFATVITAELWKLGQMRSGDKIQFVPVTEHIALQIAVGLQQSLDDLAPSPLSLEDLRLAGITALPSPESAALEMNNITGGEDAIVCRQAGDRAVLVEFGSHDGFNLRQTMRIAAFIKRHENDPHPAILEIVPGVRTALVLYQLHTPSAVVLDILRRYAETLDLISLSKVPSRQVCLPFAFDDSVSQAAVSRYMATIRPSAPYLPSNTEFLRRLNFPDKDIGSVEGLMMKSTFLVLGLGDVYMGSPCAIPLDPRDRLFGTKYNPSRTFTPRGSIGIGGQYLCIYATESPGGYQLVGRTVPIWAEDRVTTLETTAAQKQGEGSAKNAWVFQILDRITFYPISEQELDSAVRSGNWAELIRVEQGTLDLDEYESWLKQHKPEIDEIAALRNETVRKSGIYDELVKSLDSHENVLKLAKRSGVGSGAGSGQRVAAQMPGRCFKVEVLQGSLVSKGDVLVSRMTFRVWENSAWLTNVLGRRYGLSRIRWSSVFNRL